MSPSPPTGRGKEPRSGGRVRGVPSNDERQRDRELRDRAREMRANPTPAERRLWAMLRDRRVSCVKFRRQHVIGPYIVDLACLERALVIEADGGQHAQSVSDRRRDAYLRRLGFRVLRIWNNDVIENADGVFRLICTAIHTPHPPTAPQRVPPSPLRGEGLGDSHA
jgi:very-short-patch-repair endonuclease